MTYEDALDIVQRHEHIPLEEAEPWLLRAHAVVNKHRAEELLAKLARLDDKISSLREEQRSRTSPLTREF